MSLLSKLIERIPATVCSLVTTAVILWLTLAPQPVGDLDVPLFPGADKVVHAVMFGFLTWVLYIDCRKLIGRRPPVRAVWLCAALSAAIGVLIEVLQCCMALGRSAEEMDLTADLAGCLIAALLILRRSKR